MNDDSNNLSMTDFGILPPEQQSPSEQFPTEQLPAVDNTPLARPNQKRSKKFNEKEDALLVSAWLNISTDPVQETNQTRGTFWMRVYDYYRSNKELTSNRSQSSLLHGWKAILENVNNFCGCVTQIELRNQSGVTYQVKVICIIVLSSIILMPSDMY